MPDVIDKISNASKEARDAKDFIDLLIATGYLNPEDRTIINNHNGKKSD